MKRALLFGTLFSIFIMIGGAFAILAAERQRDGLWVTFESSGARHRLHISDKIAGEYVRAFAAGEAANQVPEKFAKIWLRTFQLAGDPRSVHVTRAEECKRGACHRLQGLYAGRSPAF